MEMRRRHHPEELIHRIVFENPARFLSQSPRFRVRPGITNEVAPATMVR
jgi:hypothetical protein